MNLRNIARKTGAKIVQKSPAILTGIGCAGVISTVIFAVRATPKAQLVVDRLKKEHDGDPIPKGEMIKNVAPIYIPTGLMACVTIGCIIGANRISSKRNAVLASLYSASELALKEYQEKVMERIGEKKEREVRDSIAADHLAKYPIHDNEVIITGKGQSLCFDTLSGRYFMSDYEQVRRVENTINRQIISDMWATLNEVYYELGLKEIDLGKYIGWDVDNMLHFEFSSQVAEDGRPCLVIGYTTQPINHCGGSDW